MKTEGWPESFVELFTDRLKIAQDKSVLFNKIIHDDKKILPVFSFAAGCSGRCAMCDLPHETGNRAMCGFSALGYAGKVG